MTRAAAYRAPGVSAEGLIAGGERRTAPLASTAMDELAYYRRHSRLTDPGAKQHLFTGLPVDMAALAKVVGGVLVHMSIH